MDLLTQIVAFLSVSATVVLTLLKFLDRAKIAGLEAQRAKVTDVVTALGAAIDDLKPILGATDARILTGTIRDRVEAKGGSVALTLDTILSNAGLNTKSRGELLATRPTPPIGPPPPASLR